MIARNQPSSRRFGLAAWGIIAVLATGALSVSVAAQEKERDRETEVVKERIQSLAREAAEMQKAGRKEEARKLAAQARDLEAKLAEALRWRRAASEGSPDLKRTLGDLDRGSAALRRLGRHEEAESIERIARGLREELGQRQKSIRKAAGKQDSKKVSKEASKTKRLEGKREAVKHAKKPPARSAQKRSDKAGPKKTDGSERIARLEDRLASVERVLKELHAAVRALREERA